MGRCGLAVLTVPPASGGPVVPHPSLKPQSFLRQLVRAVLPLGRGVVLDPFAGSGSTLAASNAVGYQSVGVEQDRHYFLIAKEAVPKLSALIVNGDAEAYRPNSHGDTLADSMSDDLSDGDTRIRKDIMMLPNAIDSIRVNQPNPYASFE